MAKTVAEVLREAKDLLSNKTIPRQLRPVLRSICGLDRDLSGMVAKFLAQAELTNDELLDRAIALAEAAEKDSG